MMRQAEGGGHRAQGEEKDGENGGRGEWEIRFVPLYH